MSSSELIVTPTTGPVPIKHGDFATTIEALAYAAQTEAGFNFFDVSGQLTDVLSYKRLQQQSLQVAVYLQQLNVPKNSRMAIVAQTSSEFLILFFACQYAGIIPCPVAFSLNLGGGLAYIEKLTGLLKNIHATAVACPDHLVGLIKQAADTIETPFFTFKTLIEQGKNQGDGIQASDLSPLLKTDAAYIQFSSGSTTNPKGVQITQSGLHANIHAVLKYGMNLRVEDRSFNWLPFHHNMGLIGFVLASVYGQRSVDCLSAENFIQNPLLWLKLMSTYKTCITFSPVFGYQLAMKKFIEAEEKPVLDLSPLRIAGIGGDMISSEALKQFSHCFASSGFKYQVFLPSYGLTETTLAVSTANVDKGPVTGMLKQSIIEKEIVSCGQPLPGFEVKIIDANTQEVLPEQKVGQIWVKGESTVSTYIDHEHEILTDTQGFIYTGDLGYFEHKELFISGREKGVIIIRGRNIWSQDVEWALLKAIPQLGNNSIAAIGINEHTHAEETLLIIVSLADNKNLDQGTLTSTIQRTINQVIGVQTQVMFVMDPLPLTFSGKLARAKIKEDYLTNGLIQA